MAQPRIFGHNNNNKGVAIMMRGLEAGSVRVAEFADAGRKSSLLFAAAAAEFLHWLPFKWIHLYDRPCARERKRKGNDDEMDGSIIAGATAANGFAIITHESTFVRCESLARVLHQSFLGPLLSLSLGGSARGRN